MIQKMPYGSLPVAREGGGILEYPHPLLRDFTTDAAGDKPQGNTRILEEHDQGHRHFSHMHWLYPGVFLPSRPHSSNGGAASGGVRLYDAAREAMDRRRASGHTGWSAAWQAALWARLWRGKEAWVSIRRLLTRYTTDRYLTVHPKLQQKGGVSFVWK